MSSFNYMDNVPVKISEKYKPPPRIYQLPTSIVNKLQLPEKHYQESPQYSYDFQLERKVLSKIPEYRSMRQTEREARQGRRESREQEKQRQIEEKHKKMLGAVSYPNAAELSSSEEEQEEDKEKIVESKAAENLIKDNFKQEKNWQHHNFDNILKPTVLSNEVIMETNKDIAFAAFEKALANQKKTINSHSNSETGSNINSKLANTFNYKDFEEFAENSSPFDNIELKTINDLDILAQVLHDTQLKANKDQHCNVNGEIKNENDQKESPEQTKEIVQPSSLPTIEAAMPTTAPVELQNVNFSDISLEFKQPKANYIPTQHYSLNTFLTATHNPTPSQIYHNQNLLYSPNCNQFPTDNKNSLHQMHYHYIGNNNENDQISQITAHQKTPNSSQLMQVQQDELHASKSKSVPDIIRELRDEVRNSEIRRTRLRNHSFNQTDEPVESESEQNLKEENVTANKIVIADECLAKMELSLQTLAKNISSMGFPLERVAKVAKIYGDDDKKIVEHLIPLTELLDLGFDETRISEALIKFDNNKEKALEHLIS